MSQLPTLICSYNWVDWDWNYFSQDEDRYVSFYGNASYQSGEMIFLCAFVLAISKHSKPVLT